MLSILIPCYRTSFSALIKVLLIECTSLNVPVEILIGDDGNDENWQAENRIYFSEKMVRLIRSEKNIGRAGIRNLIARHAKYDYLLFLDADILPVQDNFLQMYLEAVGKSDVICGGRVYEPKPPKPEFQFHWHYGRNREVQSVATRSQNGWKGFQTNNFMIRKSSFDQIKFDDQIHLYGHEDTLFGFSCHQFGYSILHIDNPAIHVGLDDHESFIRKIHSSIRSLAALTKDNVTLSKLKKIGNSDNIDFVRFTRLSSMAHALKQKKIHVIFMYSYNVILPFLRLNFKLNRPFLFLVDVYKLGYYFQQMSEKESSNVSEN